MKLIISTITALIAFIVALNNPDIAGEENKKSIKAIALLIGIICTLISVYQLIFRLIIIVPAGTVAVVETFGKVSERSLKPGVNFVSPLSNTVEFSTRLRDIKETVAATSSEGLNIDIDVSLQYRIDPQQASSIYQNIGIKEQEIIVSRFRAIIRQITAQYPVKDIYGLKRQQIAQTLHQELSAQLNSLGFIVEEALLRKIVLPQSISVAIQQKIEAEQASERQEFINNKNRKEIEFTLEKEKKQAEIQKVKAQGEAERRKIEAQGIAESQKLIAGSLTDRIIELRAIEATQKLAESPNTKTIVVGRSKDGLPLILQGK